MSSKRMSGYDASRIRKTNYVIGPLKEHVPTRLKYVIGFDSEADTSSDGRPMLFQFSLPQQAEDDTLLYVVETGEHAGLRTFLSFLTEYCVSPGYEYLIYGWNLAYELTQLFHDLPDDVKSESDFEIGNVRQDPRADDPKYFPWSVRVGNQKRQLVQFYNRNPNIKVTFLDGTAFYKISLDKAARMLRLGEKYELEELSRASFTRKDLDNPEFIRYAKRDAYITRLVGEYIQEQHVLYKVPTCISAPHFAATLFRTKFLKSTIVPAPPPLEQAGLYSYHGGKNGFYLDEPTYFPMVWNIDITSAYPEAMRQVPFERTDWRLTYKYEPGQHGLYQISGKHLPCIYRSIQNHEGKWYPHYPFENVEPHEITDTWITSYELDEIMKFGELDITKLRGWILTGDPGGLAEYVDSFFHLKRTSEGPERETAKLFLNSLYGKFFQKTPVGIVGKYDLGEGRWLDQDKKERYDYEAGGLYNPPLASLITGFVRAKVHRLEHKYESVMTSTDGLFGTRAPDQRDVGKDLGQLTATLGKLRIWRERLYIFDALDGTRKFALHGFHAGVVELNNVPLQKGTYEYYAQQMITLKMSTRMSRDVRYSPGQFVKMPFKLEV